MTDESDHVRLILIERRLEEVIDQMEAQTQATQDLVEAWRSARTMIAFVQVLAKVAAAIAALWLMARGILGVVK